MAWCTLLQLGGGARSMFSSPPSSTTTTTLKVRWIQRALVEKVFFRSLPHEFQVPIATKNHQAENPGLMVEEPLSVFSISFENLASRILFQVEVDLSSLPVLCVEYHSPGLLVISDKSKEAHANTLLAILASLMSIKVSWY